MLSKVLIVDDSKVMHSMYSMMLKRYASCQVLHASDGKEGLDLLAKNLDCQLVILDMNMPVMGGLEFIERCRNGTSRNDVPVVIVSTEGLEEQRQQGLEAGAAAYLTKPFQPSDLHGVIERLLGNGHR